ncbi:class I SAM-dependent methyltransferase [Pseudacidovorax intermedius]|uniref:SAM-dependent methyltransferase n=1 Tax=Pseudacidovorax intermedius TaxID=433924 RepID=A0A147H0N9_9BURK|nr:class I SAM-dependent methyltransferase [Pseudacidovorax intermedius]KTT23479.1 SAM-dependent methyltransferase [Pseudacidovorax intermedius]
MTPSPPSAADDQAALWNGAGGRAWVEAQPILDQLFAPVAERLIDAAAIAPGHAVLDVGCGTGATTLLAAEAAGPDGSCLGVDLSAPMVAHARQRAAAAGSPARFVCADAQAHGFAPGAHAHLLSRFGLMFFADPVAAFANLHRAMAAGGTLTAVVWRSATENPFMTTAERAALSAQPALSGLLSRRPDGPGQFAFADARRVDRILQAGGWTGVSLEAIDLPLQMPMAALPTYVARLGPLGRVLPDLAAGARPALLAAVQAAFAPFVVGERVAFDAACWLLRARRG